jgi:hypothetical protein
MQHVAINRKNLRRLAALNGHTGIADLARKIGKSRAAIYAAVDRPHQFGPTWRAMERALPERLMSPSR